VARGRGEDFDAARVDEEGALRVEFAAVHVRPRRAVDAGVGPRGGERRQHGRVVHDVEPRALVGEDLVAAPAAVSDDGAAQHPARARDKYFHKEVDSSQETGERQPPVKLDESQRQQPSRGALLTAVS
jgi:hypothetical protein